MLRILHVLHFRIFRIFNKIDNISSNARPAKPAKALDHDMMDDSPTISTNKRSRSNADGLELTQSERASVIHDKINAKCYARHCKLQQIRK